MEIAIRGGSKEEMIKFLGLIYTDLLNVGDKATLHFPDGRVVGYEYSEEWKPSDPDFVLKPEILGEEQHEPTTTD